MEHTRASSNTTYGWRRQNYGPLIALPIGTNIIVALSIVQQWYQLVNAIQLIEVMLISMIRAALGIRVNSV